MAEGLRKPVSERIGELRDKVEYRRGVTEQDHEAIFRLRYDACRRIAAIDPSDGQRFDDSFDWLPNVHQLGVYIEDRLAASLRIHVLSRETPWSPALDNFPDVLEPELASNKRIVDPNRLMSDFDASRSRVALRDAPPGLHGCRPLRGRSGDGVGAARARGVLPAGDADEGGVSAPALRHREQAHRAHGHRLPSRRPRDRGAAAVLQVAASEREHLFGPSRASGTSSKGARTAA